jgi:transcriptional regulator with XRE-family HTH domain
VPDLGDVVAAAIRAERARLHLSQQALADQLGWPRSRLGDIEIGRRNVAVADLPALCDALGVGFTDLLTRADPADLAKLKLRA